MLPNSPHDAIVRLWLEPIPARSRWYRYLGIQLVAVLGLIAFLYWLPQG